MSPSSRIEAAQALLQSVPLRLRKSGMLQLSDSSSVLTTGAALALADDVSDASSSPSLSSAQLWRERLLSGQLLPGKVVEICVTGPSLGTSVALAACRAVQRESRKLTGQSSWCAFVDPSRSLYAPGVYANGIELRHLLVVRPDEDSVSRVALRLAESQLFPLVVVDLMTIPGSAYEVQLNTWIRVVRRLSLALENTHHTIALLTEKTARRPLGLPVAQRIELSRASMHDMKLSVTKGPRGEYLPPTRIKWPRTESEPSFEPRWRHVC